MNMLCKYFYAKLTAQCFENWTEKPGYKIFEGLSLTGRFLLDSGFSVLWRYGGTYRNKEKNRKKC